jgi:nucleobase transporter 1/2
MSSERAIELETQESIWDAEEEQAPAMAAIDEESPPDEKVVDYSSDDEKEKDGSEQELIYAEQAKLSGTKFTVTDIPSLWLSLLLGMQHYLTMLGASVLIPIIVCGAAGGSGAQTAQVISTCFFVSGINTLIQTTIGSRLPVVQGGSFAYLPPVFQIIAYPDLQAIEDDSQRFEETFRTIQGAIIVAGLVQIAIGYTGVISSILRFISPLTIAPVVAAVGLGLYNVGFSGVASCWSLGLMQMGTIILFSQYLKFVKVYGLSLFALFPIVLAIVVTWSFGAILTAADVWEEGTSCRTDLNRSILEDSPWFRFPYPGQWGPFVFQSWAIIPMLGGMLASMIESIGDYYACAKIAGAPPPTPGIISRGLGSEGIGVVLSGLWGTGSGTTSYSENIGAMSITGVGSRAVVQCGACIMLILGLIVKIGALFATMPGAMTAGIYCCVFGLIVAVGLSNLQYIDLNSPRNLFILGFAIFNCLSIAGPAGYFRTQEANPFGNSNAADIAFAIFSSPMIIAFICAFTLDNTVSGTPEERGMHIWDKVKFVDVNNEPEYVRVYSLPLCFAKLFRNCGYLEFPALGRLPDPPRDGHQSGRGDAGELFCPCFYSDASEDTISSTMEVEDDKEE